MVKLVVRFKPGTSFEWADDKLEQLGLSKMRLGYMFEEPNGSPGSPEMIVQVSEEDEIFYTRKIILISPQVVSVSRARNT